MIGPLKKTTLVDSIIKIIMESIDDQILKPGDRLPSERTISKQLNVSRSSVREALQALAFSGTIIIKAGSGAYLSNDEEVIWDVRKKYNPAMVQKRLEYMKVCEYRMLFDSKIAILAAKNATENDMQSLRSSYNLMSSFLNEKKYNQYYIADLQFHKAIAKATHNNIISDSYGTAINYLSDITPTKRYLQKTLREHESIMNAICENKSKLAGQLADKHIFGFEKNLFGDSE